MSARVLISNVMAGGLIGVINITVAISVAALMFAGTQPQYFAAGVAVLLVGTVISALGGTSASGFPGVIVAPRSGLAPVFAGLVASIVTTMTADGHPDAILPTIVMTIMVTALSTGLVLVLLGYLKLGNLVRYIPYPVMGGFFAGIGLIFVQGGISVASGEPLSFDNLDAFLASDVLLLTLPAVVFAVALYETQRRWGHWLIFPLFLVLGFGLFYVALGLSDKSLADATAGGWLPAISATKTAFPVFDFSKIAVVDWFVVMAQAGSIATVAVLSAIILLLDTSGIEIIAGRDLNPDRELKVAGFTNVINGIAGGYPGVHVASDTALTYKLGGDRRLTGFVYAGVVVLAIAAGTGFIGTIPTFILGGLLIYVGIDFMVDWAWKTRNHLPLHDYLVILLIFCVIAAFGILQGVAFGFAVAIVLFVITYSRLSVIKSEVSASAHASHVDRNPESREILKREGHQIWIMRLQGFIFFGTADNLLTTIKARLSHHDRDTKIRYLVLGFRHVSRLDTSAVQAFSKLALLSDKEGVDIVLTEISEQVRSQLRAIAFFTDADADAETEANATARRLEFAQLDDGVAWCEAQILAKSGGETNRSGSTLEARLTRLLGDSTAATGIAPLFERVTATAGDFLFHQGEPGDCLYLVHSGVAAVVMVFADGRERVVRIYQEGAIVGEMALYTGSPRSASVRIEESGTLFRLDRERLQVMQNQHPVAAGLFHSFVVRLLADKLDRATKELQRYA